MNRNFPRVVALALAALALAGCAGPGGSSAGSSSGGGTSYSSGGSSSSRSTPAPTKMPTGTADLASGTSSLGKIVVDGKGLTVYVFDKDKAGSGTSACAGQCLVNWPPVHSSAATPTANGVTGTLGTITATDGSTQITLNGLPLYHFKGDSAPGDVNGQAVQGIWWVVAPTGTAMH